MLEQLRDGFLGIRQGLTAPPTTGRIEAGPLGVPGKLWHARIAENPDFGVARSEDGTWGWLVREELGTWTFERRPPEYEESYFEGDAKLAGGYGQYAAQAGWRLEKAARQLRELQAVSGITGGRALDLGSGYGYFRRALADGGFEHEGIEVSQHARNVAEHLYGFSTMAGTLDDRASDLAGRYQLITLWDVIEHVADPVRLLSRVAGCLSPGGVVAIKTPNLDCPEAEMFGPYYHSLKREHLVYFTPKSLEQAAHAAGLRTVLVSSTSHLLVGFVGPEQTSIWEKAGRGADITAYFAADGLDS
ncbi:MAG TPA: class I SAM-dependent methyltransferase [Polyangiaceae bacterium]|nr:class I SAM-dependent methyltransferase [Polyangiaceae bacterium]